LFSGEFSAFLDLKKNDNFDTFKGFCVKKITNSPDFEFCKRKNYYTFAIAIFATVSRR
jgi:hypothetical protein